MRAFFAALYKDMKLFLSGAGLLAVLLPALLLPALSAGTEDLSAASFVRSFPIAVRDEDGTLMSRTLVMQLRSVELFSEVRVLEPGVTDAQALSDGAAAVATIPKDFFYDVYDMSDCPVDVTLNSDRPLDSAIFRAVFTSVMGIIRANHASALAVYTLAYGELDGEALAAMRASAGDRTALDALGRQNVFTGLAGAPDVAGALTRRLAACVLGVLALFFAMGSARATPEERRLGVAPRLRAMGLGAGGLAASKLAASYILSVPAVLACAALSGTPAGFALGLYGLLLFGGFGLMSLIASAAGSPESAQRWGNILILLSLALGGTLWPQSALPALLRPAKYLAMPYYASLALECRNAGLGVGEALRLLWPAAAMGAAGLALSGLFSRAERRARAMTGAKAGPEPPSGASTGFFRRLLALTPLRLRALAGGFPALAVTVAAAFLCGLAAFGLSGGGAETLRLAVLDLDGTRRSRELTGSLADIPGVDVLTVTEEQARRALLTGEREGLLTLGPGYGEAIENGGEIPLSYDAAPSAVTAQGARELAAGQVMSQLRLARAPEDARELLGRELTPAERERLSGLLEEYSASLPALYAISWSGGRGAADPFAPSPMAFACLAGLFTALTAASALASRDARAARRRMASLPRGRVLYELTELLALTALAGLAELGVLAPGLSAAITGLPAVAASSLCFAALAILLARLGPAEGRLDALAPILALFICLLGGCFMDLSALPDTLARLTLISPAALAVSARSGSLPPLLALLAESAALTALASLLRRHG